MAKGIKTKKSKQTEGFAVEVIGLGMILFAVLALVCLITGDGLFFELGLGVRNFLLGVFGVYAYIFTVHFALVGVSLVAGKALFTGKPLRYVVTLSALLFTLFLIIHLAGSYFAAPTLGEELDKAYLSANNGGLTAGGALASLIVYPVASVASKVGAFVIFIIIGLLLIFYMFKDYIFSIAKDVRKVRANARKNAPEKRTDTHSDEENDDPSGAASPASAAPSSRPRDFFFNERSSFAFRTKREIAEGRKSSIAPNTGVFELKNIVDFARKEVYDKARGQERADVNGQRAFMPDRSVKVELKNMNGSPMRVTNVSEPVKRETVSEGSGEEKVTVKDVYTVPVPPVENDTRRVKEPSSFGAESVAGVTPTRVRDIPFGGVRADDTRVRDVRPFGDMTEEIEKDDDLFGEVSSRNDDRGDSEPFYEARPVSVRTVSDRVGAEEDEKTDDVGVSRVSRAASSVFDGGASRVSEDDAAVGENAPRADDRRTFAGGTTEENKVYIPRMPSVAAAPKAEPVKQEADDEDENDEVDMSDGGYSFIPDMPLKYRYVPPRLDLLRDYSPNAEAQQKEKDRQEYCKNKIKAVFGNKNINVDIVGVIAGSTVTRFDVAVPDDVSLSDINSLKSDLAFRLRTGGEFRMYNIPNTELIGIEVASEARKSVGMRSVFLKEATKLVDFAGGIWFMLGEDVLGSPVFLNLRDMPHLLVCGATGTGKSVCLNTMLISLMYRYTPAELRFILVDPKAVEFKAFEHSPYLLFDEILGFDENGKASKAIAVLEWAVKEMDRRYRFLAQKGCKTSFEYNDQVDDKTRKIPYLVILIDEFADFIMASPECKKNIEIYVARLAAKARAAGMSLILATQRPSADIISGTIKNNIPARICFKTTSAIDSRVVIDGIGAEKLLSKGDSLYVMPQSSEKKRAQGAFIDTPEIAKVLRFIKENNDCYYNNNILDKINKAAVKAASVEMDEPEEEVSTPSNNRMNLDPSAADDVTKSAIRLAIYRKQISTSLLRTFFRVGYNRANSIIIWMERMGYITAPLDNQTRKTIITKEQYEELYGEYTEDW